MSKELIIKGHKLSSKSVTLCVPVVASTRESVIDQVKKCVEIGVPIIELRADYFDFLTDEEQLLSVLTEIKDLASSSIILFTIRTSLEGGEFSHQEDVYKKVLLYTSTTGKVDIIDVESSHIEDASHLINQLHDNGAFVLASHHDFNQTPEVLDMMDIYDDMLETGADILKLAVMPQSESDVFNAFKAAHLANEECEDALIVMISMGQLGKISRIAGSLMGSCISFASLTEASAPGQIDYAELSEILRILEK